MAYKVGEDISDWLEAMVGKMNFGCAEIPTSDLPMDFSKFGSFDYVAADAYEHIFTAPLEEDERELVLYAKGIINDGEVTLLTTEVSRTGFTVQAPINCRVDFIIGYKND